MKVVGFIHYPTSTIWGAFQVQAQSACEAASLAYQSHGHKFPHPHGQEGISEAVVFDTVHLTFTPVGKYQTEWHERKAS